MVRDSRPDDGIEGRHQCPHALVKPLRGFFHRGGRVLISRVSFGNNRAVAANVSGFPGSWGIRLLQIGEKNSVWRRELAKTMVCRSCFRNSCATREASLSSCGECRARDSRRQIVENAMFSPRPAHR